MAPTRHLAFAGAFSLVALGCASKGDMATLQDQVDDLSAALDEQSSQLAGLQQTVEDAETVDVTELEGEVNDLRSEVEALTADLEALTSDVDGIDGDLADVDRRVRNLESLPAEVADIASRVDALEDAAGNDHWSTSGYSGASLSSTWQSIASVFATTTKSGPIAAWATASGGSLRIGISALSGTWSDTSEDATGLQIYTTSTSVIFEPPTPGTYEISVEMSGGGGYAAGTYSLLAVQLTEAP